MGSMRAGLIFKDNLLPAQEWSIPTIRKWSKGGRRPVWMSKEAVAKLRLGADVLSAFWWLDQPSEIPAPPETRGKVCHKEDLLLIEEDQDREHRNKLDRSPWDLMGFTREC